MTEIFLGLMSGTSTDGVDAVLAEFEGETFIGLRETHHLDYPPELRRRLLQMALAQPAISLRELCMLDQAVAETFAAAALELLRSSAIDASGIKAIGSHGQTLFHDGANGLSLQLGDPNLIAARTGITTVADFRRRDLALGGQGAPLVPAFHHAVFAQAGRNICVLNVGGIANVTLLPGADAPAARGFDTGPGNALLDEWTQSKRGQAFDQDGRFAASGRIHAPMVEALLADPYFAQPPPKSTGRDYFRLRWMQDRFPRYTELAAEDVQASLSELTAVSIAQSVEAQMPKAERVLVCGGGARNIYLIERLRALLPSAVVEATDQHGLNAEWVEATAFAWLAMRTLRGQPGNLPGVTGARRAAVLGGIYPALTTAS